MPLKWDCKCKELYYFTKEMVLPCKQKT